MGRAFRIPRICDIPLDVFYNPPTRERAGLAHCVPGDSAAVLGFVCPSRVMGENPLTENVIWALAGAPELYFYDFHYLPPSVRGSTVCTRPSLH
ncbi:MAG: hypothetical protein BWY89_00993 [Bacteroidetes bacterium ADurb.BinA012]|nr:MAG: hypothetical protein BWY89_00993 [Bacteroidetes bacterium ADurb.BinA012]